MSIDNAGPVIVNTDGTPLELTASFQTLYTVPDGETHEVYVWCHNDTTADVDLTWQFKTGGADRVVTIPAKTTYLVIPGVRFLGVASSQSVLQFKAPSTSQLSVFANANRAL